MKRFYILMAAILIASSTFSQTDSTVSRTDTSKSRVDTLVVGNFIIIKKRRDNYGTKNSKIVMEQKPYKATKVSTNWWILDLGFANVNDKTNYANADPNFLKSVSKEDLKLKAVKSSNVNIWIAMQRLSLAKGFVNLKYGVGLEMFNFRYQNNISYHKNPTFIYKDTVNFSKNKLYAGYLTVPLMLNFNTSPGRKKGLIISGGISAGYLIGSHTKQISDERGKIKTKGDLGLEQFRLAYVGELGIGPLHLFGSYSIRKLHENGLEQYPYSFGIRFSSW